MNKTHLRRSLAAVGLAVITLMAMSTPASAAVHNGAITGGVITSTKTGVTEVITLGTTTSCTTTTLAADFGTETLGGTFIVTALGSSHVQAYSNGQSYLTVLSRSTSGNVAGTWTSGSTTASHTVTSNRIAIVATIYNTTTCSSTGLTPVCTVAAQLHITSTFATSLAVGNPFSATGSSVGTVVAFPTCAAGPSQILGTSLTVTTAITGTITT